MRILSVVIPALNEAGNIRTVLKTVPVAELAEAGWRTEIIIVDNGSTDGTGDEARQAGARVVFQPARGYGNAYKAGLCAADGEIVVTGDADRTYPFDHVPRLLRWFCEHDLEFLTTNRLGSTDRSAMKPSHAFGNQVLSAASRVLFGHGIADSQSGMWMFRREVWARVDVRSPGMAFSQEIKNEAHRLGLRCAEVPIEYRPRDGEVKLNAARDGLLNLAQLVAHRLRPLLETKSPVVSRPVQPVLPLVPEGAGVAPSPVVELRDDLAPGRPTSHP